MAPARTRLARKQNAGLLVGSPSFADTASRSRSQPKMEDNLFTSPKANVNLPGSGIKLTDGLRMDTRSRAQWIVAVLLGVGALSFPVFADEAYTYSGDFNLQIPADLDASKGWMDDAVIEIDRHVTILDLDVSISLTHSNVFDLQIYLQSPEGTTLSLNSYNPDNEFFKGKDYSQTVFDDEAQTPIGQAEPPFTGQFRPDASDGLEVFNGQDAYGSWQLQIYDAYHHNTGILDSFELTITVPEPATVVLLTLGAGLAALLRPRQQNLVLPLRLQHHQL